MIALLLIVTTAFSDSNDLLISNQTLASHYLDALESSPLYTDSLKIWYGELDPNNLTIHPNDAPQPFHDLTTLVENTHAMFEQIPQHTLESCEAPISKGYLYTTGEYNISAKFSHCLQSVDLYLHQVNRIEIPLNKQTLPNLHTLTVNATLDDTSIEHLLHYSGHLTVLGSQVPAWVLENLDLLQASSLSFPEVSTLSASEGIILARFQGQRLSLNSVQTLSKREAKAFAIYPHTLEFKGIQTIKPNAFAALMTKRHATHVRMDTLTPEYLSNPIRNTVFLHNVQTISLEAAAALTDFQGQLHLPDLQHLSPEAYMHLLGGGREAMAQGQVPTWYQKERQVMIPFENLTMTTEWIDAILFLEQHFWKKYAYEQHHHRMQWLQRFGTFTADGLERMLQNLEQKKTRPEFPNLQTITPDIAQMIVDRFMSSNQTLQLDGLASIDDQSLTILMGYKSNVSLNNLKTLTPSQVEILSKRGVNGTVSLQGLEEIDANLWTKLAPLKNVTPPKWLREHPEYIEHHINRKPGAYDGIDFRVIGLEIFKQIDFSEIERLYLTTLPEVTPAHIQHIAQFPLSEVIISATQLTPANIDALQQWPHPTTKLEIEVLDAPIEKLSGIESTPVDKLVLAHITSSNPDLSVIMRGSIPNLEIESELPIQGVDGFKGNSLQITRYRDHEPNRYSPEMANDLIQSFQGNHLTVGYVEELTPELAKTIMTRHFDLTIHTESLPEDAEPVLQILQQSSLRNLQTTLTIEGLTEICVGALGETYSFDHINESAVCEVQREQLESQEYWEHHDCEEHDSGEH